MTTYQVNDRARLSSAVHDISPLTDIPYKLSEGNHYAVGTVVQLKPSADFAAEEIQRAFLHSDYVGTVLDYNRFTVSPYKIAPTSDPDLWQWFNHDEVEGMYPPPTPQANIQPLAESVRNLYARFGVELVPFVANAVFSEEMDEFRGAAAAFTHDPHSFTARSAVAQEFADVLYTATGLALSLGLEPQELQAAVEALVEKNNAKNSRTHTVVTHADGSQKIARRALLIIAYDPKAAQAYAAGRSFRYITRPDQLLGRQGEVVILYGGLSPTQLDTAREALRLQARGDVVVTEVY